MDKDLQTITAATWNRLARYLSLNDDTQRLAFIGSFRPQDQDYARVFRSDSQELARRAYGELWDAPALWPLRREQTELKVVAATIEQLQAHDPNAAEFPGGYWQVLHHYEPGTILLCWEFMVPGESLGLAFDGLVAFPEQERWSWFPKPWRVLPADPGVALDHWVA